MKIIYSSSLKKVTVKLFFIMALLTSVFANAQDEVVNNDIYNQTIFGDDLTSSTDFGNTMDVSKLGGDILATTPFSDDVTDVPGAPVDDWAFPFVLLSLILGYFYFRRRTTIFNS